MKTDFTQIALEYLQAGIKVIPVNENKESLCRWGDYYASQTEEDIKRLFKNPCFGIAMLTGGDEKIEVLDIDCKYDLSGTMFQDFKDILDDTELISIYDTIFQRTPTGGFHAMYKCDEIEGNQKLASRAASVEELEAYNENVKKYNEGIKDGTTPKRIVSDRNRLPKVLFETRGTKGYVLIDPTPKYLMQAKSLLNGIPKITPEQREAIFYAAKSFHSIIDQKESSKIDRIVKNQKPTKKGLTCWDDYNDKADTVGLLEQHGWKFVRQIGDRIFLRRPAKTKGTSGNFHLGLNMFKTFSTSTLFEDGKAYTPYAVYAELEHNGDFSAAAKELYRKGYGDRIKVSEMDAKVAKNEITESLSIEIEEKKDKPKTFEDILKEAESTKFSIEKEIVHKRATLHYYNDNKKFRIAGDGMILGVTGDKGSGKTLLLSMLLASALSGGQQILNYSLDIQDRKILDFDTEQPSEFFQTSRRRAFRMAHLRKDNPNYYSYNLRAFGWSDRFKIITHYVKNMKDIGVIIIDGIVDLIDDYNDLKKSQWLVGELMKIASITDALIIPVLHEARSTGRARGHLGTELENKADCILNLNKNRETLVYTIAARKERFAPFPKCEVMRDEMGYPYSENTEYSKDYYDIEAATKEAYKSDNTGKPKASIENNPPIVGITEPQKIEIPNNNLSGHRGDPDNDDIPF